MALTKVKGSGLATGAATDNLVGIDDNATSTAITIDASENVGIGIVPIAGQHSAGTSLQLSSQGLIQGFDSNSNEQLWVGCNNYYSSASTNKYIETDAASRLAFDNAGNMTFYVAPSGTAGNAISWTTAMTIANGGNVTVNTGNLVIGTSGKGIDFSANGNAAGMTSEVLDDYEEGTWTPTVHNTTSEPSVTYDWHYGNYTKIGNMVQVWGTLKLSSTSGGVGSAFIDGLPFSPNTNAYDSTGIAHYNTALPGTGDSKSCMVYAGTRVYFESNATLQDTGEIIGSWESGYLGFSLSYKTNS